MHHLRRKTLPFTAIVGQEEMKFALILNAINPRIGGVLIRGEKGTAKSTAVRALADLLEKISVVEDCPFNCNPASSEEMCDICYDRHQKGQITVSKRRTPVIDLPLGATEDRVVGSLDVERAIKEGIKALEPGILAAANRGILYIDETNLLDDHVADVLLDSAAMGVNIVEREGVSVAHPSRFILIGTMNPEEGELRPQLLDRFGLQVNVEGIEDVDLRMEIARTAERFEADPDKLEKEHLPAQEELRRRISQAKEILKSVAMDDSLLRTIASACTDMGIKTHRAEIVISRTAKTIAAFDGRTEVSHEDIRKAMMLALPHRMRSRPFEPPTLNQERLEKSLAQHQPPKNNERREEQHEPSSHPQDGDGSRGRSSAQESIFDIGNPIDVKRLNMSRRMDKIPRRKISGRRINSLYLGNAGRYLRHRFPQTGKDIAIDATIRAAAPYQPSRTGENAINIRGQDIREKERIRKVSSVVLFVVDASGSMGAARRMESAKGAILSMLMDSYQKRDKIGLLAFRGEDSQMLLQPSSSVDLAMSRLSELPTGGKTPLSAGLSKGLQALKNEIKKDKEAKPIMVLISDGRANVALALNENVKKELMDISEETRLSGVHTIVIDTETAGSSFLDMKLGYCKDIAEASGGRYYPLSDLSPEVLCNIVDGERELFWGSNT